MNRFLTTLAAHPWATITVVIALTGVALAGIVDPTTGRARLRIDASTDKLVTRHGGAVTFYEKARLLFGNDEPIILALSGDALFRADNLERIERLTRRLEALGEVRRVVSLSTAVNIRALDGFVDVAPFLEKIPRTPEEQAALRDQVLANPLYAGTILSADGKTTALFVHLRELSDRELSETHIVDDIERIAREEAGELALSQSGIPYIKVRTGEILLRGFAIILPGILVLSSLVLLAAFRSLRGVLLPVAAMMIALVWTLGTMGWLGRSLNLVTTILPPLVATVGFAYTLHVISEYYDAVRTLGASAGPLRVLRRALEDVTLPLVITAVTTMGGLLSLAVSPLWAIREFGVFAVVGIAYAVTTALVFIPAALHLLPLPDSSTEVRGGRLLRRAADHLGDFAFFNRRLIIAASLALLLLSGLAMTRIRVGTDYISDFSEDSPVRRDYELVNERLGGANSFFVMLESPIPEAFLEPDNLREMRAVQAWLEQQPEVGTTSSIADYLMLLNRAMHDGDPDHFAVPDSRALASQLLFFGATRETQRMLDAEGRTAVVSVRANEQNTTNIARLVERIEARLAALPEPISGRVTGRMILLSRTIDDIARGQLVSLGLAVAIIYLVLSAMFTSLRIGLVALLPNILPIALYFGALAAFGITLNTSTSLIACIALGIAVDDTIHYFARFNRDAKRSTREIPATRSALRAVIRPVTFTSLGLCLGFAMLMASEFRSQVCFGALAAFTLAVAWLIDVTLTPALCSSVRIVTLWDVLRLDLGEAPQHTIEFFRGLSLRQARIVALMGSLEEKQVGETLRREGEIGCDLYIVLEGELVRSVETNGRRTEIGTIGKGGVVGVTEHFARPSTEDVEIGRPTRLMRFTSVELERLGRRYPRIAVTVYRNLNRIQAERLVTLLRWVAQEKPSD